MRQLYSTSDLFKVERVKKVLSDSGFDFEVKESEIKPGHFYINVKEEIYDDCQLQLVLNMNGMDSFGMNTISSEVPAVKRDGSGKLILPDPKSFIKPEENVIDELDKMSLDVLSVESLSKNVDQVYTESATSSILKSIYSAERESLNWNSNAWKNNKEAHERLARDLYNGSSYIMEDLHKIDLKKYVKKYFKLNYGYFFLFSLIFALCFCCLYVILKTKNIGWRNVCEDPRITYNLYSLFLMLFVSSQFVFLRTRQYKEFASVRQKFFEIKFFDFEKEIYALINYVVAVVFHVIMLLIPLCNIAFT